MGRRLASISCDRVCHEGSFGAVDAIRAFIANAIVGSARSM
jgi:hypothetical protein